MTTRRARACGGVRYLAVSLLFAAGAASAQDAPDGDRNAKRIEQETRYVAELIRWGFPDLARKVSDSMAKVPGADRYMRPLEIKSLILQKKYADAKRLLAESDRTRFDSWQGLLDAADAFYQVGQFDETQSLYDDFFKAFAMPPSGQDAFYKNAAYRYSQMLRYMKRDEKSLAVYEFALRAHPDPDEQLQMWVEMAQLAVRVAMTTDDAAKRTRCIEQARKLATDVQWKGISVWFGKSIVVLAQIEQLLGKRQSAMKIITDNLDLLAQLHDSLRKNKDDDDELIKMSPMVECRFVLGCLYQEEGMELASKGQTKEALPFLSEAVQHLFNVFARYPTSMWASQAGQRAQEIFDYFDSHRVSYKKPPMEKLFDVLRVQIREAKMLVAAADFEAAAAKYREILTVFPEVPEESTQALANMAICFHELKDELSAKTVTGYIVERFRKNPKMAESAGNAILIVAGNRLERGDTGSAHELYDTLVTHFPRHPQRAATLIRLAQTHREKGDLDGALRYYEKVQPGEVGYASALSHIAYVMRERKEYAKEIELLQKLLEILKPGHDNALAQYRLASATLNAGQVLAAARLYNAAVKSLRSPEYSPTAEEGTKNKELIEAALFNTALACARVREPEVDAEALSQYRAEAVKRFEEFSREYPESRMAAPALLRMGIIQMLLKDTANAAKTFDRLQQRYAESEEAKGMHYVRAKALIEMGFAGDAQQSVEQMLANAALYTPAQFIEMARVLVRGGEGALAIKAFQQALAGVKEKERDRWILEGARFEIGRLHFDAGRLPDAIKALEDLFRQFPNTGYTADASFMLSRAYREIAVKERDKNARFDLFNKSVTELNRLPRLLLGPLREEAAKLQPRISLEVARTYDAKAAAEQAAGDTAGADAAREQARAVYFRLFQFSDSRRVENRTYMEEAFKALIPYEMAAGRFADIVGFCRAYLESFPEGAYVKDAERWRDEAAQKSGIAMPPPAATNGAAAPPAPAGEPPPEAGETPK